ncbi:Cwf15/Cwc15 cell cycle control protein [Meira miltonrushii]|uniref:Cwf15/Cwc15 cell cycle control protein n=1 Tax=Meira miltonrushii TaxID=1280837 RepID=A0A316V5E1_9BASI|nr:Cwf15/Cwc15 cell cycle control protein [Meira miltonrushii]PWN32672.1 Cwf15/Cwc15 cell cycle control protein [Meira miltonrushii]
MSSAHRPTWDPAKGRADDRHKSARVGARQMPAHTKLKFRQPQQGGPNDGEGSSSKAETRRDLKRELEEAERASRNKKRKEQGLALEEDVEQQPKAIEGGDVETDAERRKLIAQLQELDADEESDDETPGSQSGRKTAKIEADSDSDDSSESEDDDEEDDTAALLRELEKIKRERAEEKERQERERSEMEQSSREEEIALGNPLLNLEHALKGASSSSSQAESTGFGVKRRWDDDVIFKNQAAGNEGGDKNGFVNDLTRSEFHKRFMQRYVR